MALVDEQGLRDDPERARGVGDVDGYDRLHGAAPAKVERIAPLLGQDTDRVLSELLGLTADDLAALHAAGVIEPLTK